MPTTFPCGTRERQNKFLVPLFTLCLLTQVSRDFHLDGDDVVSVFEETSVPLNPHYSELTTLEPTS